MFPATYTHTHTHIHSTNTDQRFWNPNPEKESVRPLHPDQRPHREKNERAGEQEKPDRRSQRTSAIYKDILEAERDEKQKREAERWIGRDQR